MDIQVEYGYCPTCGQPVIDDGNGILEDVVVGGTCGSTQIPAGVEHECN